MLPIRVGATFVVETNRRDMSQAFSGGWFVAAGAKQLRFPLCGRPSESISAARGSQQLPAAGVKQLSALDFGRIFYKSLLRSYQ